MRPSRADKLRWAAGALSLLAQKIAEAGDDDELLRAHLFSDSAISLLELMLIASDETLPGLVRTTAYREMTVFRERVERVFSESEAQIARSQKFERGLAVKRSRRMRSTKRCVD